MTSTGPRRWALALGLAGVVVALSWVSAMLPLFYQMMLRMLVGYATFVLLILGWLLLYQMEKDRIQKEREAGEKLERHRVGILKLVGQRSDDIDALREVTAEIARTLADDTRKTVKRSADAQQAIAAQIERLQETVESTSTQEPVVAIPSTVREKIDDIKQTSEAIKTTTDESHELLKKALEKPPESEVSENT